MEKGYYTDSHYVHLWLHLVLKANHSGKEFMFSGKMITLKRGQFVTGRKKIAQETGIQVSKVERILKWFETEQQIEQRTNMQNRIITILNYQEYQKVNNGLNTERTTSEQRVNTTKELKNNKKVNTISQEMKDQFDVFRKSYPGITRGLDTELDYLRKTHNDWEDVIPILSSSLKNQISKRVVVSAAGEFLAPWKNLKTWIYNRCWEEETGEIGFIDLSAEDFEALEPMKQVKYMKERDIHKNKEGAQWK